jgi:plastocyanin
MRLSRENLTIGIVLFMLALTGAVLLANRHSAANSGVCGTNGPLHQVTIQNNRVSPENTDARLCDRLQFTNEDNTIREIAFGPHEHHVPYDGVTAKVLYQHQSFTITLNKLGQYHFHDHIHDEVTGFFTVSK